MDCTWGAGYLREQTGCFHQEIRHHCLFTDPRDFIRDHCFPLRSEWQLLNIPVDWNIFISCALVKYGYFVYRLIIPECYNKHTLLCGSDINIRLGLTMPLSISYDLLMVRNNNTWINKSSHVSLHTFRNAVITTCSFLSNGSYLLNLYGKPKGNNDIPKPTVCYHIKVTEENLVVTPTPCYKCDIVWGTWYYFECVAYVNLTFLPLIILQINLDGTSLFKHSGKCQLVRKPGVIILYTSHLIPGYYAVTLSALTSGAKEYVTTMVLLLQYIIRADPLADRVARTNKDICKFW